MKSSGPVNILDETNSIGDSHGVTS
jgi:hypothetical protein